MCGGLIWQTEGRSA